MTVTVQPIYLANNTLIDAIAKANNMIDALAVKVVTVNSNSAVGNAQITGSLTVNNVFTTNLSGGVAGTPAALNVTSNVAFTSNISFAGSNNSFGAIGNMHATGANATHRTTMANNSTGHLYFGSLNAEIQLIDGANSGIDSDLLDGQEGAYYANIAARQGFTSANKAGDTFTGNVEVSQSANTSIKLTATGSNTSIIFNNNGGVLEISGSVGSLRGGTFSTGGNVAIIATTATLIHQFAKASFRAAKYLFSITNGNANAFTASELLVVHNSGDAMTTEYAVMHTNTAIGSFSANTDATNVRVYFTSTSNSATVKFDSSLITA